MSDLNTRAQQVREAIHKFGLDHRDEFDEVFIKNAYVHIERMNETGFWMGIEGEGLPRLMVNTGVHRGVWFFNIYEDSKEGKAFEVRRPRKSPVKVPRGKPASDNRDKLEAVAKAAKACVDHDWQDMEGPGSTIDVLRKALEDAGR